jgi:hypothetical protein
VSSLIFVSCIIMYTINIVKTVLRNLIALLILAGIVYFATNYVGALQQQAGVKGASTSRAKEISGQIGNDIGSQIDSAEKQIMELKVSDIVNGLSRFQRVPQDVNGIKNFVQKQVGSMLQSSPKEK